MIRLDENFDGHLILYCKGHYHVKGVSIMEGFRRIWAVRCGYGFEFAQGDSDEYIANRLLKILKKINPKKIDYLGDLIHKEVSKTYLDNYKGLSMIETLIHIYRSEIAYTEVRKTKEGKTYKTLVKLPTPQVRVFRGIVSANEKFNDYKLVKP